MSPGAPLPYAEVALPALAVEPGHVAEARRALKAQGKAASDDAVTRMLWVARALPAAVDLLSDVRAPLPLAGARFTAVNVELLEPAGRSPLLLLGRATEGAVLIDFVDLFSWLDTGEATVRCRVSLAVGPAVEGDESGPIRMIRFQAG